MITFEQKEERKERASSQRRYIYTYIPFTARFEGRILAETAKLSVLPCENIETGGGRGFFVCSKNSKPRGYRASAAKGETETAAGLFAPPRWKTRFRVFPGKTFSMVEQRSLVPTVFIRKLNYSRDYSRTSHARGEEGGRRGSSVLARRKFTFAMPFPNFFPDTITEDDANFPISPTNGCMRNYCPKFTRFDPLPSVSFFLPFMRMYLLPVLYIQSLVFAFRNFLRPGRHEVITLNIHRPQKGDGGILIVPLTEIRPCRVISLFHPIVSLRSASIRVDALPIFVRYEKKKKKKKKRVAQNRFFAPRLTCLTCVYVRTQFYSRPEDIVPVVEIHRDTDLNIHTWL